jgi:hypothetical protein
MSETCPTDGCSWEGKNMVALGQHFSQNHEGVPPWNKIENPIECPKSECDYEGKSRIAVGTHWSKINHEGTPPWKQQTCDWCGDTFEKCDSQMTEAGSYCSEDCYGKHISENIKGENHPTWNGGKESFTCDQCGEQFKEYPANRVQGHTFCEYACFREWETIHGESRNYGPNWKKIRQKVIKRDEGTCTFENCDKTECEDGRGLHVHHIKPFVLFDKGEEANRLKNLRVLCAKHHREVEVEET